LAESQNKAVSIGVYWPWSDFDQNLWTGAICSDSVCILYNI